MNYFHFSKIQDRRLKNDHRMPIDHSIIEILEWCHNAIEVEFELIKLESRLKKNFFGHPALFERLLYTIHAMSHS